MKRTVFIGFDPREAPAYAVARYSLKRRALTPIPVRPLILDSLQRLGLYTRPTERRDGRMWDVISEAPCATQFAISRFLVPHLAGEGWALFIDCDFLCRGPIDRLFDLADPSKAVMCVKHEHAPTQTVKMDGQVQTVYPRKNWSSAVLFNVEHPANRTLTPQFVNSLPGRDLHAFCWLPDHLIGELGAEWNYLVGHTTLPAGVEPQLVHFTDGYPLMEGYEDCEFADEWREEFHRWAAA